MNVADAAASTDGARMALLGMDIAELEAAVTGAGLQKFRARQLWRWVWRHGLTSFDEMSDLGKPVREQFAAMFSLDRPTVTRRLQSTDGTIKWLLRFADGNEAETVYIPDNDRGTLCISSQVGCTLTCSFCHTGTQKLVRNLTAAEICGQVMLAMDELGDWPAGKPERRLTNIVLMGMGEPLLNYRAVLESVERICGDPGLGMSPKRITVSTAGIAKAIKRLGDDQVRFNLALSLHAANDEKRNRIMAINESNNLEALAEALQYFHEKTGTRVTFEYIIFRDFNDQLEDAQELANFCACVPCKVNVIEYNPIDGGEFQQAAPERVDAFVGLLESRNIIVNVRRSRGKDIDAACGQLANKNAAATPQLKEG